MSTTDNTIPVVGAIVDYPYFVLQGNKDYGFLTREILKINNAYRVYKEGAKFYPIGTSGDYVPSTTKFKKAKTLIDKEARFMFSEMPDIQIVATEIDESSVKQREQQQKLISKVFKNCNLSKKLLQSAKDCFVGMRVACLIDYSEEDGAVIHFYNSLQFYYETENGSEKLKKFVSFENINNTTTAGDKKYIINSYENINGKIYLESSVKNSFGKVIEELIPKQVIGLDYIPAVVITNDGLLQDSRGVSEIESLAEREKSYSALSNGNIDSVQKGMNPIRYTVDMNPRTTENLSSSAGSYWDLHSDQNQDTSHPSVGTLAPELTHIEALKYTLESLENSMYSELDVPNISPENMKGMITSGKTLKALNFPLEVRCNEKLKTWLPALEFITRTIIDLSIMNNIHAVVKYELTELYEINYNVDVKVKYALLEDTEAEKELDMAEIATNVRSRKSYLKKYRSQEFQNDEQIDEELLQIAKELSMFDSGFLPVEKQIEEEEDEKQIEEEIEGINKNREGASLNE